MGQGIHHGCITFRHVVFAGFVSIYLHQFFLRPLDESAGTISGT
ncbi:hypothetical protein ADICYQ_0334 [Cyclobacterium qasimii M12-11B]|uniref:Uncharacterized protein n=1 Tax=Cyclobacterium qasimii M12-11B TaxID=641524 RepID=S7VPZ7_9BACT|nr:hypothetical protein ADICYQ_0334 [Cyclobacterium qasimii M12-11B]